MTQINIRLNEDIYEIISYLASKRMVSKSEIARELLLKSLTDDLLPILLKDYQAGKISLKKIIAFTKLSPIEVLRKISTMIEDPPISAEVDDYTENVTDELIKYWKEEKKVKL